MEAKLLKDLKKGEYFTLKPVDEPSGNLVWVKGDYDRASKTYGIYKFSDMNHESFKKATTKVYAGFTF